MKCAEVPTFGSLFSGIGGFDLGLGRAGWTPKWQVENNPFRRQILKRHWPDMELRNDIKTDTDGLERVDLVCGGFPCQDLSVAGKRAGLAGERSSLFFQFARILESLRPRWCLIENVPGLLSSNDGRDFAVIVTTLADIGYWWSYRVLDSQYFGVPQRRRRVYIVGHLGGPCPPEILFEPESLSGNTAPGGTPGSELANSLRASTGGRGTDDPDRYPAFIPEHGRCVPSKQRWDGDTETFIPERAYPLVGGGNDRHDESQATYVVNVRQTPITGKPSLVAQNLARKRRIRWLARPRPPLPRLWPHQPHRRTGMARVATGTGRQPLRWAIPRRRKQRDRGRPTRMVSKTIDAGGM